MSQSDWNDYGAITVPLIVTLVLILLAFAPVLDSKMWQTFKDIISVVTPAAAFMVAIYAYEISRRLYGVTLVKPCYLQLLFSRLCRLKAIVFSSILEQSRAINQRQLVRGLSEKE